MNKTRWKKLVCKNCSKYVNCERLLNNDEAKCGKKIELITPKEDEKILRFKNFKNKIQTNLVVYGDFESLLRKYKVGSLDSTRHIYQEHLPLSVGYYLVSKINPSQSYYKSYIGAQPAKWFANELYNIALNYQEVNILCFIFITYNIFILDLPFELSVRHFQLFNHV